MEPSPPCHWKIVMEKQTFSANEILFNEGDDGEVAYLVENGTVEISIMDGGTRNVLGEIEKGGLFGEMALIGNLPRMATATASCETTVVIIHRKVLRNLIENSDALMSAMLLNLIGHVRSLSEKLNPGQANDPDVQVFYRGEGGAYKRR